MDSSSLLLPPEIILNIVSRLPVESVLACRRVCKTWRTIIVIDTYFADMHLRRQLLQFDYYSHSNTNNNNEAAAAAPTKVSFLAFVMLHEQFNLNYLEYDMIDTEKSFYKTQLVSNIIINKPPLHPFTTVSHIIGSCNGLICVSSGYYSESTLEYDPVYICNPVTREYMYLPRYNVGEDNKNKFCCFVSGFGYLPSTNQYKVVRICYERCGKPPKPWVGLVQVYTLGDGNGWRNIGEINDAVGGYFVRTGERGIPLNGAIYWLLINKGVLVFDLLDEELRLLPTPSRHWRSKLCVLRGMLRLVHPRDNENEEIWTLQKKKNITSSYVYGVQEQDSQAWGWSKEINMEIKNMSDYWSGGIAVSKEPLALTDSGEIVLWFRGTLVRYDPKTANFTKLGNPNMASFPSNQAIPHVNSFVSLKALGEDAKIISTDDDGALVR